MAETTHLWKRIFKSQFQGNPLLLSPSRISWDQEKAFAEDTSGPLGGSVWPPRSYSCSFCMRQFRSAQALGGHMNVHRRDRARLQQPFVRNLPPNPGEKATDREASSRDEEEGFCGKQVFKRPKISISYVSSFCDIYSNSSHGSTEELDLELRLGDAPKARVCN